MDDLLAWGFVGGVLVVVTVATVIGQFLARQPESGLNPAMVATFNRRVRAWWLLGALLTAAILMPEAITVFLFFGISFWALREFITLTPTRLGDHRALFWVFVLFTPMQYILVGLGQEYYRYFAVVIPIFGTLFVPARVAFSGDHKRFLERIAKIQTGLVICVYFLSFAPALLYLPVQDTRGETTPIDWNHNALLLCFLVVMSQFSDAMQFVWGRILGKRVIAEAISPNKTWEGFLGSVGSTGLLAAALFWVTPFNPWQAAGMGMLIAITSFAGGMTMSAIKRDRGVEDYGTLVVGHGGVLDRLDSLCFSAPVFYHLTYWYFAAG